MTGSAFVLLLAVFVPSIVLAQAERQDTLVGAGIERYRVGAYRDAIAIFESILAGRRESPEARLYASLSHLQLGEDAAAQRHLLALRDLRLSARLRNQVDHVLEVIRAGAVTPPLRRFIAAALDETMLTERSVRPPTVAGRGPSRNFPYFP